MSVTEIPLWQGAVVYQIFPRSFADSNGDGIGDSEGLRRHLDYLQWLGVDAIWLSPMFRSPWADGGYDISDHKAVDPAFGTLEQFDRLIAEAHARDLRVLLDYVPNHTSDQHPWFIESRASRDNPKRDWYIWRDETNNWRRGIDCKGAWTWDERTQQHYLHLFLPEQPDLDWRNPQVVEAMHDVLHFWIDRGVDGFRMDAVHCIGKDMSFADDPRCDEGDPISLFNNNPYTHDVLRGIRRFVDTLDRGTVLVGEVNIRDTASVVEYYGAGDQVHMSFNFLPIILPWDAGAFRNCIQEIERLYRPANAWPTWVLSNHDRVRHRTRFGGSMNRARAAAVMLLTLRGTPFMYQGEELGLEEAQIDPAKWVDPSGRDGVRAPIPWTAAPTHGWDSQPHRFPFPPDADMLNVERQMADEGSILHLYKRLLALRRANVALRAGSWEEIESPPQILAYRRKHHGSECVVCINFGDQGSVLTLDGDWTVELASAGGAEGLAFDGRIEAEQALILVPRRTRL